MHTNPLTSASRTLSEMRAACASLFLGHRAEIEERLAVAVHDDDPAAAARLFDEMQARISAQADRIAAEDAAFYRAPSIKRRIEAGHRYLMALRQGEMRFVPLCELTDAEIGLAADPRVLAESIKALPPASTKHATLSAVTVI